MSLEMIMFNEGYSTLYNNSDGTITNEYEEIFWILFRNEDIHPVIVIGYTQNDVLVKIFPFVRSRSNYCGDSDLQNHVDGLAIASKLIDKLQRREINAVARQIASFVGKTEPGIYCSIQDYTDNNYLKPREWHEIYKHLPNLKEEGYINE